ALLPLRRPLRPPSRRARRPIPRARAPLATRATRTARPPRALHLPHAWNRRWPIRCFRTRSWRPPAVLSLAALGTRTRALRRGRQFASAFDRRHILKPDGATMQSARLISSPWPCAVRVVPRRLNQLNSKCNSFLLIDHHAENGSGHVTQIQPCFTDL